MKLLPFDYAARNAGRNPLRTLLATVGAGAVVFLVILMGAFVQSLDATLRGTGDPLNMILMGAGSEDYLEQSEIGAGIPSVLEASVPQIARHHDTPLISPEIHHATVVRLPETDDAGPGGATRMALVRGITPVAFLVHRQVFLKEGRPPGMGEVMAGRLAAARLGVPEERLRPGQSLVFEGRPWKISGVFEAPGTAFESEIWAPLEDLRIQTRRDSLTAAVVRLRSPEARTDLQVFTKTRLDLELAAVGEADYYARLAAFYRPMRMMGWAMALLVVGSGLFGGLNTMFAAIASRARELACLETIGFSRRAIVTALLQESLLQAGTGALLAAGLSLAGLSGRAVRFSMGALALEVTGPVLAAGFGAALFLAVAGTLIPALRLLRTPLVELLRE